MSPWGSAARACYALIFVVWGLTVVVVKGCRKCIQELKHCDGFVEMFSKSENKGKEQTHASQRYLWPSKQKMDYIFISG